MYYGFVILAALCSALAFCFNKNVEKQCENGMDTAIVFSTVVRTEILLILLLVTGGNMQITPFSFCCAFAHAAFLIAFSFLNLKALGVADLSKYSMFTMLGGMTVPFVFGILLFHESVTPGKVLCCILVFAALYIDSFGKKVGKKAVFYLMAVFFVNGSFGVITAIHQNSAMDHVDTLPYMCLQSLMIVLFGLVWCVIRKPLKRNPNMVKSKKAYINMLLYGIGYGGTELILLFTIKKVPASVQYAIMTGGVIIFSTVISMINGENRNLKSLASVGIAFVGLLLLLL